MSDAIGFFAVESLNELEPAFNGLYSAWLLPLQILEAINLILGVRTLKVRDYSGSMISTFQSISPWSMRQKLPRTFALKISPSFRMELLTSSMSSGSLSP